MTEYVRESGASAAARRRRRRSWTTLLILVLGLFFAFWYAYSYYRNAPTQAASPRPTCTTTAPTRPVTLNVYNATNRTGLARATADALARRGFVLGNVANDPLHRPVKAAAEIRYGPGGAAALARVKALVTGAVVVKDARRTADLDLVLGNGFTALLPPPATPTPTVNACS